MNRNQHYVINKKINAPIVAIHAGY